MIPFKKIREISPDKSHMALEIVHHIQRVQAHLRIAIDLMIRKALHHDASKLEEPELTAFTDVGLELEKHPYGSEGYDEVKAKLGAALQHHYENNRHHPEYHGGCVDKMSLMDLLEMVCDWVAASERRDDGCPLKSIVYNQKRFGIGRQLASVMLSTVETLTGDEFDYSKLIPDTALDVKHGAESGDEEKRGTGSPELD